MIIAYKLYNKKTDKFFSGSKNGHYYETKNGKVFSNVGNIHSIFTMFNHRLDAWLGSTRLDDLELITIKYTEIDRENFKYNKNKE